MEAFKHVLNTLKRQEGDLGQRPVMGWNCTYLPLEILEAGGFRPYRILPEPSSEKADSYLDPNYCPLVKASLGKAIEGGYSFLAGIVMVNTCDGMRRLYDAWRFYCSPVFSYLLDLPRVITPSSLPYFTERLRDLIQQLEIHFKVRIPDHNLAQAIEESNLTRRLLKRLTSLKGRGSPPFGYGDLLDIIAQGWRNERSIFNNALKEMVAVLEAQTESPSNGLKLLLTGSLLEGSWLTRLVEELGGEVAVSDLCTGERSLEEIALSSDPLSSLSRGYLGKTPCARMADTEQRISHIRQEVDRTGAKGVIYFSLKFCDPYLYEAPAIQKALQRARIPLLFVEGEYTGRVSGGVRTRVQAFLEMIERNAK